MVILAAAEAPLLLLKDLIQQALALGAPLLCVTS